MPREETSADQATFESEKQWLGLSVFDVSIIQYLLSSVRGADILLLNRGKFTKNGELESPEIREELSRSDPRRSIIGDYLPNMADTFTEENWLEIIQHTLEGHLDEEWDKSEILNQLKKMNPESLKKVKTFAIALLRVWNSNVTLKSYMRSDSNVKGTVEIGYLKDDIELGSISLRGPKLDHLMAFSTDHNLSGHTLHKRLKGNNNSSAFTKNSRQLQVFLASASFISENKSIKSGGVILADNGSSENNTEIQSILLHIQAALSRHLDFIESGHAQELGVYIDKAEKPKDFGKWGILFELQIAHLKFYESLNGLFEVFSIEAKSYINSKIEEVKANFPLPSSCTFYEYFRIIPLQSAESKEVMKKFKPKPRKGESPRVSLQLHEMEALLVDLKAFKKECKTKKSAAQTNTSETSGQAKAKKPRVYKNTVQTSNQTSALEPATRKRKKNADEAGPSNKKNKTNISLETITDNTSDRIDKTQNILPVVWQHTINLDQTNSQTDTPEALGQTKSKTKKTTRAQKKAKSQILAQSDPVEPAHSNRIDEIQNILPLLPQSATTWDQANVRSPGLENPFNAPLELNTSSATTQEIQNTVDLFSELFDTEDQDDLPTEAIFVLDEAIPVNDDPMLQTSENQGNIDPLGAQESQNTVDLFSELFGPNSIPDIQDQIVSPTAATLELSEASPINDDPMLQAFENQGNIDPLGAQESQNTVDLFSELFGPNSIPDIQDQIVSPTAATLELSEASPINDDPMLQASENQGNIDPLGAQEDEVTDELLLSLLSPNTITNPQDQVDLALNELSGIDNTLDDIIITDQISGNGFDLDYFEGLIDALSEFQTPAPNTGNIVLNGVNTIDDEPRSPVLI